MVVLCLVVGFRLVTLRFGVCGLTLCGFGGCLISSSTDKDIVASSMISS